VSGPWLSAASQPGVLMTSTLPYSGPARNSCTRDSASILLSGDSAAPVTGMPRLSKVSWPSPVPAVWGDGQQEQGNVGHPGQVAAPGDDDHEVPAVRAAEGLAADRDSLGRCRPGGIATEPVTCPSAEARTTTSSPATTP
jgi:hypothetical protein